MQPLPHSAAAAGPPPTRQASKPVGAILSDGAFSALAALIHRETGIVITEAKRSMLVSRLSRRLRSLGLQDFSAYLSYLDGQDGPAEREVLVSAITTNVTGFFREPHHFDRLAAEAPQLIRRARAGGRVRLWSAGCSTGQEAVSMAAVLADHAPDIGQLDLRILATDIDPAIIAQARQGQYDRALLGPSPPPALMRHIQPGATPDLFAVSPKLRSMICFEVLNLLDTWPFQGRFDVIFCRNVVIYFDDATRNALWSRFAERLLPGGLLFIGHSERMDPGLEAQLYPDGLKTYRRGGASQEGAGRAPHGRKA
jgi:chemotaxis protein methyltransferase CheR